MSSRNLNLAVVGTGIFATDEHLPNIQKIDNLTPVAAYNRTRAKAEAFAEKANIDKANVYDSLEEVFSNDKIDFVDALLPVQHNLDVVKLAVQHKKPLAFEKPIAANLSQAKEIVQLARSSDVPIAVLENWSFRKATKILKEEIIPKIGDIISFTYNGTGAFDEGNKYSNTSWRVKPEHIGGYLSDGGVHQLALLTDVLGPVESISAFTKQVREQSGDVDILFSTVQLKSKAIGTFTYGSAFGATDKNSFFTIFGTNGSIVYNFSPHLAKPTITYQTGSSKQSASEKVVIEVDEVNTTFEEFTNFAAAVEANDKSLVVVTPEKAFHHLAIVDAALQSSKNNGSNVKVELP
ncbi:NAD(P)-binding protein [Suhomyces tanzawaensis NRRL Y-17324]|uniref:NAD(P)-binding protein n=1 Tax=Suhomyces tanzawaensis NRRL Y-17324 TaxID=984487 RepID=A0A1E4SF44_9ASCO|nr:NAD(P)-binding protein [Suhomyces tanzawaensis NRRL Y-17324]ODV78118.1 NAD(P)-binding protein [Suhomyces tanzawaensis NRRL Y-17324]